MNASITSTGIPPSNNVTIYCNLKSFSSSYRSVHGYFSLVVCIFGSVTNVLNICVLSTEEMRWPTNFILTGMAVADLLVMLEYLPLTVHSYLDNQGNLYAKNYTYSWAVYAIFHALFTQVFHFISCCLTVILAVWRYIAVSCPQKNNTWCNFQRTRRTVLVAYLLCPLVGIPMFLSHNVKESWKYCDENGKMLSEKQQQKYNGILVNKTIYYSDFNPEHKHIMFLVYGVVIKLIPCILLTVLLWKLISALVETKKNRKLLLKDNLLLQKLNSSNQRQSTRWSEKDHQTDRTTRMLVAVLLLFLITEFPQAILGSLCAIFGDNFEKQCYLPLGDFMDILALVNSGINFLLYCSMSRQFRITFKKIFIVKLLGRQSSTARQHLTSPRNNDVTQFTQI